MLSKRRASNLYIAPNKLLVHPKYVRTSITLDDDAYQLASLYAAGRGITLSAAINEAVRRIVEPRPASGSPRIKTYPTVAKSLPPMGGSLLPK
jgi:hypothetical protein